MHIPINLSNRHIHLTPEDVIALFGEGYTLNEKVALQQPGQYAAEETVTISGPNGAIERVRVVGPTRDVTQCEILRGDVYRLGFAPEQVPVRLSGDITGSAAFTIVGPAGEVFKGEGLIIAQRHVHMDPAAAGDLGVSNGQAITLHCDMPGRVTDFHDVIVRIQANTVLECHLDIEEGNAAGIANGYEATVL